MSKCPKCGKGFGLIAFNLQKWVSKEIHPEWTGQLLHPNCVNEAIKEYEKLREKLITCENCYHYRLDDDSRTIDTGIFIPNFKVYTFTSRSCTKFGFSLKADGEEAEKCTSYITPEEYKEKALSGEMNKDKPNVQINLDFSSLKEVMNQGGVVMTTYKCPNCSGMVNIPEAGKVLMCNYCGTPIKPVDIFEKISSLIQSDVNAPKIRNLTRTKQNKTGDKRKTHPQQTNQKPCKNCNKPTNIDELNLNNGVCNDCWDTAKMKEEGLG